MTRLKIDHHEVEVPAGSTILAAARQAGIDIPTLCSLEGYEPATSCLVCMVKILPSNRLVPACATRVSEGMVVQSETEEVHHVRRTALELLFSDHLGDCLAPCHFACPAHMDVPVMLRQIATAEMSEAIATVKRDIAIPAVLGRICPKPCEKGCRRSAADGPVAVCQLKRFAADTDLATGSPYVPPCQPDSGKKVAIVGAGPTGLSAAYFLRQHGHACTVFDDQPLPGGRLRHEPEPGSLPVEVLDAEIAALLSVGVTLRTGARVGQHIEFAEIHSRFDAVLLACGATGKDQAAMWRVPAGPRGIHVNKETFQTEVAGVFAAGNAIRGKGLVVRSAADGKEAALSIDQFLRGEAVTGPHRPFSCRIGKLDAQEMPQLLAATANIPRAEPDPRASEEFSPASAAEQASRCLHCDCRSLAVCKLRRYAEQYGADASRFASDRRPLEQYTQHADVIFEPGKCIRCGLCIQIAAAAKEPLGLTFIGRGFDVRVGVPFDGTMDEALRKVAAECVAACPTAALAFKDKSPAGLVVLGQQH